MRIEADQEAMNCIFAVCDIALKAGGLRAFETVARIKMAINEGMTPGAADGAAPEDENQS